MTSAARNPLPAEQWCLALATLTEAWQAQQTLCTQYQTALGINAQGWFVACPGSGLSEKAHTCEPPPRLIHRSPEVIAEQAALMA